MAIDETLTMAPPALLQHVRQRGVAAPQRGEQRATHLGLDLMFLVMLEGLGPDGSTDVVDEDVETAETLFRGIHHPMAIGELLEVGGQGQDFGALPQLIGQFMDQFGTVHGYQPAAFLDESLGDTATDALGRAGNHRDLVLKSCVHLPNLWYGEDSVGNAAQLPTLRPVDQALAANFS